MIFKNISKNEMMTLFPTEINIYLIQRKYVRHARASMLVTVKQCYLCKKIRLRGNELSNTPGHYSNSS